MAPAADVTDAQAMRELVAGAQHRFGRIDGWFHCAGVPLDRANRRIDRTDRAAWREILAPRVRGALVLDEVFAEAPADFGIMMSSLASLLGGTGDAGDAAAGRFLDARSSGTGGLVAVNCEALSAEQGVDVLDLVLRHDAPSRLAVSGTELERRIQQQWAGPEPVRPAVVAPRRLGGEELKRALAKIWSEALRTEVDRYDVSILDLGGDEMLAVRLARRIAQELGVPLTAIQLLTHPTIDQLAARLDPDRAESSATAPRAPRRRAGTT